MAHESTKNTKYKVDISNSFINTLVIGDGNIIRNILPSQQKIAANQNGESRGKKRQKQSKIRFPQRKFGRESRTVVKEDNECVNVNLPVRVPPNSSDAVEKGIFTILNLLHPLRDSGKWQEFNNVAENLRLKNQENLTFNILITLEQSVVESYHNKIEKAEEMVKAALQILEKSKGQAIDATSYLYLITMAHIHLTGFYRRQNKHGKAEEAINIGYQNSTGLTSHFLKPHLHALKIGHGTPNFWYRADDFKARHPQLLTCKHSGTKCNVAPVPKILGVPRLPPGGSLGTGRRGTVPRNSFV